VIFESAHACELFLSAGHVQELAVRSVKQSDTKGNQDAHDPKLKGTRNVLLDRVRNETEHCVRVQEENTSEKEWDPAYSKRWQLSFVPQKGHATGESNVPGDEQTKVGPSYGV
jgi:hypothetical protein